MRIEGTFDIDIKPQLNDQYPAGRMVFCKTYHGELAGEGLGQMLSKRQEQGPSVYCAVEEFSGTLAGKQGDFTLIHRGIMSAAGQTLDIQVLEGSGTDELTGLSGQLHITNDENGQHFYTFEYLL